jgi:spore coat protein U-like protein
MSVTLGGSGTGTTQRTLYARMYQSVVSGGIYTSSFSGGHTLFDYGYSPQFRCSAAVSNRAVQVPFTVQVNNVGDCQITTTALDFGNVENLNATVDASNTIAVNCSNRVSYAISLDNGLSGSTNPAARIMKSQTSTDTVTYGIYTNAARSVPFGANAFTGRGDGTQRIFTAYGRIPAQATPTPSSYSDTIVVTVSY